MSEKTFEKLKVALLALQRPKTFSLRKIANTARQFLNNTLTKKSRKQPRITKPPQKVLIHVEDPFIKHERDAFKLKAYTLLTHYSASEKLKVLEKAPIKRIVDSDSKEILLIQTLKPFPGEKIKLQGTFKRHVTRTAPVAGSFKLETLSTISGFPQPSQHTGWAIANPRIQDPQLDLAKELLSPGKEGRVYAQQWEEEKRSVFNAHKGHFLRLHQKLMESLHGSHAAVATFFEWLLEEDNPYDTLSSVNGGDTFEEPWIQDYQTLTQNQPALKKCEQLQLSAFLYSIQHPPKDVKAHLETLILQDNKSIDSAI